MSSETDNEIGSLMRLLLRLRRQSLKDRILMALILMLSSFIFLIKINNDVPLQFFPLIIALFCSTWLLGIRYALPLVILTHISQWIILELVNRPSFLQMTLQNVYGAGAPFFVFLILFVIAGLGGILGELVKLLYQQYYRIQISEQNYRQVVENTTDVIYTTSYDGKFSYVSPSITQMTGYEQSALIGTHYTRLIPPEWNERLQAFYADQFKNRIADTVFQFPILMKDGQEKWVEQRVVLQVENNRIKRFHSIVRDIEIRKQLEDETKRARDEAIKMAEVKSQILANVSHDARTPLSAIMLTADMLREEYYGALTEEQKGHIDVILKSSKQLSEFLQNLVDQAKLETQDINLRSDVIDPNLLMDEVTTMLRPLAESKGLYWRTTLTPDMPMSIVTDKLRLIQIMSNLVNNAIKFTDKGGIDVCFTRHDERYWVLSIRDTGIGIPESEQSRIFDAFWQVDGGTTRKIQTGVGLGLAIVKQLVKLMHGEIKLTSQPNQGSTFLITFPIEPLIEKEV